ncbi:MAG TPA: hypothetical protein VNJ04_15795 [Gemmatimonadaceae bacterium]|nr:hypothetical protein [Gemmatimonadaceae bacterium]
MPDRNTGGPDSPTATWPSPASLVSMAHRAGQDVGRLSALAAFRLGELATSAVATISTTGAAGPPFDEPGNPEPHEGPEVSALARAEAILSRAGHQAAAATAGLREQLMRSAALAREEAEDIMVDAQELRQHGREDTTRAS